SMEKGRTLEDMVASGEIAAAIGIESNHPDVKPLIPNAGEVGLEALRTRGHYPINHTLVVKDELLEANPELATDIFNTFAEAKRLYIERLKNNQIAAPTKIDQAYKRIMEINGDPLPYGIEPNRKMVEGVIQYAHEQGILTRPYSVEELFARGTLGLVA
ncbi:MAG: phtD, partial [Noviherbaspirillum sp.]|nr:phtD [Noviherbaspirillum sp.]